MQPDNNVFFGAVRFYGLFMTISISNINYTCFKDDLTILAWLAWKLIFVYAIAKQSFCLFKLLYFKKVDYYKKLHILKNASSKWRWRKNEGNDMGLSRGYPNFYNCTVKGRKNEKDYDICRTFTKYFWDIPNLVSTVNSTCRQWS